MWQWTTVGFDVVPGTFGEGTAVGARPVLEVGNLGPAEVFPGSGVEASEVGVKG